MRNADRTITLYNYVLEPETGYDLAIRSIFAGVSVHSKTKVNVDKSGMASADETIIRIPVESTHKDYMRPNAFAQLETVDGYFTLKKGDKIVLGLAEEENPTPAQLEDKYGDDFCLTIIGITDNRDKMEPHWKVVCE